MSPESTVSPCRSLRTGLLAGLVTVLLGASLPAAADDTSVFATRLAGQQKPNILFVLDFSGSMNFDVKGDELPPGDSNARIAILRRAMTSLLEQNNDSIHAGLGSLFSLYSGGVRWPISELNADASTVDPAIEAGQFTVRDIIEKQLASRQAEGATSTVNALLDAALYFKGGRVAHDDRPVNEPAWHEPDVWDPVSAGYTGGSASAAMPMSYRPIEAYERNAGATDQVGYCYDYSPSGGVNHCAGQTTYDCQALSGSMGDFNSCRYQHPDRWSGTANYETPITGMCQSNFIVLISDGEPTSRHTGPAFDEVLGYGADGCEDLSSSIFGKSTGDYTYGNCGPEIIAELAREDRDLIAGIPGSKVSTYTIGFSLAGPGQNYLKRLAEAGGGRFFDARQPADLTRALDDLLEEILGGSENFSEVSVDVNRSTFSSDDRAYLNLFSPSVKRSWSGNLKGFYLRPEGLYDTNGKPALMPSQTAQGGGMAGAMFAPTMQSFWSSTPDGNQVILGGANESVIAGGRTLYTFTDTIIPSGGAALNQSTHALDVANAALTAPMLGLPDGSSERDPLLNWLATAPMGDPLHSKPVRIIYESGVGTSAVTQQVVFTITNQGFLHAFDATRPASGATGDHGGGEELFAFMPPGLLPNLPEIRANERGDQHIYGLDGSITRWHDDANGDGKVNGSDRVMLVFGMRRGGGSYHAVDVTNVQNPQYLWRIDAGSEGFEHLAQSWSRASLITVKSGSGSQRVLAFGGGYDAATLDNSPGRTASLGNAVYLVDRDGRKLWSTSGDTESAMQYAIPSDLTPIDSDADGLADRLYFGDTGGQLWRIDFDDIQDSFSFGVTRLADLHDGTHQPFFYPPSVALQRDGRGDYLSVAIGSGDRTRPLLTDSSNALFVVHDRETAKGRPTTPATLDIDDLYDATGNLIESADAGTAAQAASDLAAREGWMVRLAAGEKALAGPVTFEGKLLATTFQASNEVSTDVCDTDTVRRFYRMNLRDGRPVATAGTATGDELTRSEQLDGNGIPSSPVVVFPPGSNEVQIMVDKQVISQFEQQLTRVYWHAR